MHEEEKRTVQLHNFTDKKTVTWKNSVHYQTRPFKWFSFEPEPTLEVPALLNLFMKYPQDYMVE